MSEDSSAAAEPGPVSTSMQIDAEVRESAVCGKGLFTKTAVKAGTIICFFPINAGLITEKRFLQAVVDNEFPIVRSGTRLAGAYYTHGNLHEPYTYINHSFEPNTLCHCGIIIALRDLGVGEELTVDYRTLIDETDIGIYSDAKTGQLIRGFSGRETLLRTARQLIALVEPIENWEGLPKSDNADPD